MKNLIIIDERCVFDCEYEDNTLISGYAEMVIGESSFVMERSILYSSHRACIKAKKGTLILAEKKL